MMHTQVRKPAGPVTRIVILGGGFGGVLTARAVAKAASVAALNVRVTLIDKNDYFLFTPMLPEVGTGILDSRDIAYSLREATRDAGITFYQAAVTHLDVPNRTVLTDAGVLPYDVLVIALGATTNYFGMKDVEAVALTFKDIPDAVRFHTHTLQMLDQASREPDAAKRRALLSFVIAGGGLTGVELAAELADFLAQTMHREYPRLTPADAQITLVEAMSTLLPGMAPEVQQLAQARLEAKGVRVLLNTPVTGATPDAVKTATAGDLPLGTLVWTAGIAGNPLLATFPFAHARGNRIECDDTLQVKDAPGVYAIGDCSFVNSTLTRKPYAQSAQIAEQEAKHVAANIVRSITDEPLRPFVYAPLGVLISLGDHYSIVDMSLLRLSGVPGYLLWKALYFAKLPAWSNRAAVLTSWLVSAVAGRSTIQRGVSTSGITTGNTAPTESVAVARK